MVASIFVVLWNSKRFFITNEKSKFIENNYRDNFLLSKTFHTNFKRFCFLLLYIKYITLKRTLNWALKMVLEIFSHLTQIIYPILLNSVLYLKETIQISTAKQTLTQIVFLCKLFSKWTFSLHDETFRSSFLL